MAKKVQLMQDQAQVFPETKVEFVIDDQNQPLSTLLSSKQESLTQETKLFDCTINSEEPTEVKFGGTLTLTIPQGGGSGDENVIEVIKVNEEPLTITEKAVNIDLSNYQEKETNKGLSSNDFTTDYKNKLISLPQVINFTYQQWAEEANVFTAIDNSTTANGIPPTIIINTENNSQYVCHLSLTKKQDENIYSGVYAIDDALVKTTITSTSINNFYFRITDE